MTYDEQNTGKSFFAKSKRISKDFTPSTNKKPYKLFAGIVIFIFSMFYTRES